MKRKTDTIFSILYRLHIVSPKGVWMWTKSLVAEGISLMALLRFAAHFYPQRCALKDGKAALTYQETYQKAQDLAQLLHTQYHLRPNMRVAILGRNSLILTLLLPALSRLGVQTVLLNTDMGREQLSNHLRGRQYQLFIYDDDLIENLPPISFQTVTTTELHHLIIYRDYQYEQKRLPRIGRGREIIIHTGGSSGNYQRVERRPSVTSFLPPLVALLREIGVYQYQSVLIALPFYHGFGLATLIVSLLMGKEIYLQGRFDAPKTLEIIQHEHIEVIPIVPAMLSRIWQTTGAKEMIKSLKCMICGGDSLPKSLINLTHNQLGEILFNLYGTSEAGFFLLATPHDLASFDEPTLGKAIWGVRCKIKKTDKENTGALWVQSSWAMTRRKNKWQNTKDIVYQNAEGYFFHRGRTDRMVVCGGENVHPEHVEQVLLSHPLISAARAFSVPNPAFGNVIHAEVECAHNSSLSQSALLNWLRPQLSRAEMPHAITFKTIDMLSTGKQKAH
ncbi:class I adenylate-forming enzyme family protein [Prevotella jejuni]|uniref:class I adenylate-forming enzyme family protein n=1 Tax=Prevotella jejuni TaxID=1177574 RepID=UPI001BA5D32D|nr:AMP-binding protein [Prevotella jejuni]QUB78493.1 AMP-binding protein [Prevotella jejuni]